MPRLLRLTSTICATSAIRRTLSPFHSSLTPFRISFSHSAKVMEDSTTTTTNPSPPPTPQSTLVDYNGIKYNVIREGRAYILNPPSQEAASKATRRDLKTEDESQSVFYNPIQQFNRDLSVLAIRAFSEHVVDFEKHKQDQKAKRRAAGNGAPKGKKRKREDESAEQSGKPAEGEPAEKVEKTETSEQNATAAATVPTAAAAPDGKQEDTPTPEFTILDALSATGLRALRYASEIPIATKIVGNDLSKSAIKSMKTNIEYNKLGERIQPNLGDARIYMYGLNNKFDVIDLDPYGTASPFMDAAVQAVKDGGLLCVTCTDAGVWASTGYSEKAFSLYGGIPIKGSHSHEGGLRLILYGLAMSAAKYGMAIEPLLSLSIDFYARTFVRVIRSPAQVKFTAGNTLLHYNCDSGCGAWTNQYLASTKQKKDKRGNPMAYHSLAQAPTAGPLCEHCGFKTHLSGPMWGGRLHNPHFIQRIISLLPTLDPEIYQTIPRLEGMLTTALEEDLDLTPSNIKTTATSTMEEKEAAETQDPDYPAIIPKMDPAIRDPYPFYFNLGALSRALHCQTIPMDQFRGALRSVGYRSTRTHAKPNSIRTDAPWSVIWEIMREWVRQHSPIKENALKPGTAGAGLMKHSRDNLRSLESETGDPWLSSLKADLLKTVESGKDVADLITKVEAALYRAGSRRTSQGTAPTPTDQPAQDQPAAHSASVTPAQQHPSTLDIKFDAQLGRDASTIQSNKRLVRYQINPRANWGPLNRAS